MLHGHWLSPEAGRVYGARKIQELADRILREEENVYAGSKWPREYANRVKPRLAVFFFRGNAEKEFRALSAF